MIRDMMEFSEHLKIEISELSEMMADQRLRVPANGFEKTNKLYQIYKRSQIRSMDAHIQTLKDIQATIESCN